MIDEYGYTFCDDCQEVGDLYALDVDGYMTDYCFDCAAEIARDWLQKGLSCRIVPIEYVETEDYGTGEKKYERRFEL